MLEKEDATSQTFLNSSHLGKKGALAKPFPQGSHTDGSKANPFFPFLPLPELGNPCAKDSLEDLKPTNPFTDFTCLPAALSPGSSDVSGECFDKGGFGSCSILVVGEAVGTRGKTSRCSAA